MLVTKFVIYLVFTAFLGLIPLFAFSATKDLSNTNLTDLEITKYYENLRLNDDLKNPKQLVYSLGYNPAFGGDISGAGSSLRINHQTAFLLDFAFIDPNFIDQREILTTEESLFTDKLTPENILIGSPFQPKDKAPKSYHLLEERLSLWQKNSPIVCDAIRRIILRTSWRATVLAVTRSKEYELPKGISKSNSIITPLGLVLKGYGVFINNKNWSRPLGLTSRAGFFVHEALRSIRVEISDRLSNETIQQITAHLMLTNPDSVKIGYLDNLLLSELWSEPKIYFNPNISFNNSEYLKAICERKEAILQFSQKIEDEALMPKGWNDEEAYHYLVGLDNVMRNQNLEPIKDALQAIPMASKFNTLYEIPQRTFSFWLDHINLVERFHNEKTLPLDIIPFTPSDRFKKDAALLVRPFWRVQRQRFSSLKESACDPGAKASTVNDFILIARTLIGKIANTVLEIDTDIFYHNFNPYQLVPDSHTTAAQIKMINSVIDEAMGSQICYSTTMKRNIQFVGNKNIIGLDSRCKPIPKKYFKNGLIPRLPRINSK